MRMIVRGWGTAVFAGPVPRQFRFAVAKPGFDGAVVALGAAALEPCAQVSEEGLRRRRAAAKARNGGRKPRRQKPWQGEARTFSLDAQID